MLASSISYTLKRRRGSTLGRIRSPVLGDHLLKSSLRRPRCSLLVCSNTNFSVYEVDIAVADLDEIELTLKTGILVNPHNKVSHRMSRNSTRQATRARKVRETKEVSDATKEPQTELADELERRRESSARSKEIKEQLQALKGKGGKKSSASTLFSAT